MKKLFDFDDLLITPTTISPISSRSEINVRNSDGYLPLLTAPMDTVITEKNFKLFESSGIKPVLPRIPNTTSDWVDTSLFLSYGLDDFNNIFIENTPFIPDGEKVYALIDVANGHMEKLLTLSKLAKEKYGKSMVLMVGNVANPETFEKYCEINVDMVRIGIGNGGGCFLENSLVITDKGEKFIQDVVIGDLVLTHTGEYKNVSGTLQYPTREPLIKINDTICTKNHEYYVLNKIYENIVNDDNIHDYAEWVEADKLTDDYFLLEMVKNV